MFFARSCKKTQKKQSAVTDYHAKSWQLPANKEDFFVTLHAGLFTKNAKKALTTDSALTMLENMIETNTRTNQNPAGQGNHLSGLCAFNAFGHEETTMNTMKIRSLNSSKMSNACRGARSLKQSTDCFLIDPASDFIVGFVGRNGFNPHIWSGKCSPENLTLIAQRLQASIDQILRLAKIVGIPFLINAKYFSLVSVLAHDPIDRGGAHIKPTKGFEVDTIGRSFVDATSVLQGSMRDQDFEILFQDEIQTKIDSRVYYWKPAYMFPFTIGSVDAVEGGDL